MHNQTPVTASASAQFKPDFKPKNKFLAMNPSSASFTSWQRFSLSHRWIGRISGSVMAICFSVALHAAPPPVLTPTDAQLVTDIHAASLARREVNLRATIASPSYWIGGRWGDTIWSLSALFLNEQVDDANARLLLSAQNYNALFANSSPSAPLTEEQRLTGTPWERLGMFEYARILCFFHSQSTHFPGRLSPATEAAMKESVWQYVSRSCLLDDAQMDDLYLMIGTENHDLNYRPFYYLILTVLNQDPSYNNRTLADGHTLAEHLAAYTAYFREWSRNRATTGLWVEIGASAYQKYSWPALVNLHELSPDAIIREQFRKHLDLAFIEEEQICVKGRRGGGRSRGENVPSDLDGVKDMFLDPINRGGGSSHTRVFETSAYQAPDAAILLRHRAFPVAEPFILRNRVPGEADTSTTAALFRVDSAQVNYVYRTPHYLLGTALFDPTAVFAGISCQKRVCGMMFDNPPQAWQLNQIYPYVEQTGGGRPQNSFFNVQHKNVLLLQRNGAGAYSTGKISVRFEGAELQKVEEGGWIFATNTKAHMAVKFLDGGHTWNTGGTEAFPANYIGNSDTGRILFHAGDITTESFDQFRAAVLANPITVSSSKVDYRFGSPQERIEVNKFVASSPQTFIQPLINGVANNLRPSASNPIKTYDSPYLSMEYGEDVATISLPGYPAQHLDFTTPIVLIETSPVQAAEGVSISFNLVATFNNTVLRGTGTIILRNITDATVAESFDVASSPRLTFVGKQVTIDPSVDLGNGFTYEVEISSTAVKDDAGYNFAGTTWRFTTAFIGADIVIGPIRQNSQTSSNVNTMQNFTVPAGANRKLVLAVSWEDNVGATATWKGTENFAIAAAAIAGRNSAILYLDNPSPGTGNIVINTVDPGSRASALHLTGVAPGAGTASTGAGRTGSIQVSIPKTLVVGVYTTNGSSGITGPFAQTLHSGDSGSSQGNAGYKIEHVPGSKSYTWTVPTPIEDSFALAAFAPPQPLPPPSLAPADNAGYVAVDSVFTATYSEPIIRGTGLVSLRRTADDGLVESFNAATSPRLVISGNTLTVDPTADLAHGTAYYLLIDSTAVLSSGGTTCVGILAKTTWNFTTEPPMDYTAWIEGFLDLTSLTGFSEDADGDGIANGIEAWFGTDPGKSSSGVTPLATNGTTSTFQHPLNTAMPDGITGHYEWSTNLIDWYIGDGMDGPTVGPRLNISASTSAGTATVTATSATPLPQTFLRARVIQE